jgi:electron transport complex protein RnfG
MKDAVKSTPFFILLCFIPGIFLVGGHCLARSPLNKKVEDTSVRDFKQVMPASDHLEAVKQGQDIFYYKSYNREGKLIGAVFTAQAKGCCGTIETLAAMSLDGEIIAIKVIKQNETPGVGARISEEQFAEKFKHKKINDLSQVSAISGATVSSSAVINSVKEKAEKIQELLK